MKKKIKFSIACLLVGLFLSSCAIFGERKRCPAYSKAKAVKKTENAADYSKTKQTLQPTLYI